MTEVINSSIQGSINDIANLKFFTAKGYEIPMQKSYVLTWELIPGDFAKQYIKNPINGYFIGDIDVNDPSNLKIAHGTFEAQFINQGEIYVRFATQDSIDDNGMPVYSYNDVSNNEDHLLNASCYYDYLNQVFLDNDNIVKISINVKNESYTYNFGVNDIFALDASNNYEEYTTVKTIYTGENIGNNQEFYQMIGISKIDFIIEEDIPLIQQIFEDSVPNLGTYFPFVRYAGDFYQDKVSENFIATDTILVLEEVRNEDDSYEYTKPYINANSAYSMVFQPSNDSELKLIDKASEQSYNLLYKDELAFSLANGQEQTIYSEPFSFAIAFQADEEGAYQNFLGIYLRSNDQEPDKQKVFFMGAISVKTEVEGEDERFRTLLTNFGIPDPINYSNIFAEQDYQEEGKDFNLINKKSKELMLTYDQIFSYVGTYKALFRAIKFLGYQDIVFKEWYNIKDQNDKLTDIAIQIFDSSTGNFLKQKLADYGVSIEDFNNYNKLNKISMIYHFNERSDEVEKLETYLCQYKDGSIGIIDNNPRTLLTEVPMAKPIFTYRNEETLAKLFAVKQWLEQHIIGVGAYISDITGEGIYFGWQKTQGYQTQHHLNDFSQSQYYTADVKQVGEFINSSAIISCTLNELNNAVRFIDYEDTPIDAFIKYEIPVDISTDDGVQMNTSTLIISNSIEAPVLGDEYEFDLMVRPDSGTLYEWTAGNDSSAQILIQDGEITLLRDNDKESYIDTSCLPIITLENANIHNTYGNWRSNIKWMVRETIDSETGNTQYSLKNCNAYLQNSNHKISNQYIVIEPASNEASIKYSEKNKWGLPMFIIHGYKFSNIDISTYYIYDTSTTAPVLIDEHDYYNLQDPSCDFILEILKGDMLFKSINDCGCQVSFSSDLIKNDSNSTYANEQKIEPTYTYHSNRMPFVTINSSALISHIKCASALNDMCTELLQNLNNDYQNICNTIQSYLNGYKGAAYEDASIFSSSTGYISDTSTFIEAFINSKRNKMINSSFNEMLKDNYTFNKTIDVNVTRLGNYDVVARAFDKYNNIFTSKYDNTADVVATPIPIDTFTYNDHSNNDNDFYRFNKHGELLSTDDTSILLSECDINIKYPKSYHIYDIDYNLDDNYVEFDNISYAIDTPKNNDYVIFDTLNERCINSSIIDDSINSSSMVGFIKLSMLDENPNKIGLYANVFSDDKKQLSLFAYDSLNKEIFTIAKNLQIIDALAVNQYNDTNYESDSYIIVNSGNMSLNASINDTLLNCFDNYKVYVLNTTEYRIIPESSSTANITYDYSNQQSTISINAEQVFNNEDVVKIRYYMDVSTSENKIINETAYRIINVVKNVSTDAYEYTLNGLPNTVLLDSSNVNAYIMYAASHPVMYLTNIIGNAYEYNEVIGYENYSIIRDYFNFNQNRLFLDDYIDDTYGIEVNDYDYMNGKKYWFDYSQYIGNAEDMNMYYYHQFPVSVIQGDELIFRAHNSNNTFKEGYKKDWKVSVMSIDDIENTNRIINNNNKETLFRSVNDKLTIKPYMLGSHNIQLTCTDIYGNRLVNEGEGLLFVKESETDEYKNYSYI